MRAIAILSVVCSHFLWIYPEVNNGFTQLLRLAGFMGVEIFFVLSGYLIGGILYRLVVEEVQSPKRLGYFLIRRWFRTLPNYYLILVINIGLWVFLGRELPVNWHHYFVFLQNGISGMPLFFTESWSLPIEEFAYLIGPALLFLLLFAAPALKRKSIFLCVTLIIILFFLLTKIWYNHTHIPNTLNYWNIELKAVVLYRIDAIYYGVLFAFLSRQFSRLWYQLKDALLILGIVLFVCLQTGIVLMGLNPVENPFLFNVLYLPICSISVALSLPWFSAQREVSRKWMHSITWISLISYSMYLLHYSIVLQLMRIYLVPTNPNLGIAIVLGLAYLLITIALSYALYRLYEKPMMDLRDKKVIKRIFGVKN